MELVQALSFADTLGGLIVGASSVLAVTTFTKRRTGPNRDEPMIQEFYKKYSKFSDMADRYEEKAEKATHAFLLEWPDSPVPGRGRFNARQSEFKKRLKGFHLEIENLRSGVLSWKQRKASLAKLKDGEKNLESTSRSVSEAVWKMGDDSIYKYLRRLKTARKELAEFEKDFEQMSELNAKARASFDPMFIEKLTPAAYYAEQALNTFRRIVETKEPEVFFSRNKYPLRAFSNPLQQTMNTYSQVLLDIHDFRGKVLNTTAVIRKNIDSLYLYDETKYGGLKDRLVKAENLDYTSGNPEKLFNETIQPIESHLLR